MASRVSAVSARGSSGAGGRRGGEARRASRSRAMGTAAYLEQVSVGREHRDGPIVTRHDGSSFLRSRPASDLRTPATRTLAAGGRTRGRDRSAGRVTRASSTAAGRACECRRALGGGCVVNDASFQRETNTNKQCPRLETSKIYVPYSTRRDDCRVLATREST